MRKTNTKSLLELLARIRTIKALDRAAKIDSYYRATLKEQNMAYSELEKAGLDRKQKRIVDKVFTAINANGAAYGKVAYKLGLHDGIRLMSATAQKGGERMGNINEQIAKAEEEIRQLQNRKKKLLNQKKSEERKIRTHRLVERGAILESLLEQPEQYTNEQIKGLLETALQTPQAQEFLRRTQKPKGEN